MPADPTQVQKFLGEIDYPCTKDELMDHARQQGADASVLQTIQNLPGDTYDSPADIREAIGREK